MTAIDLFGGAGGMALGATMAGVNVTVAVEADANAASTYSANHSRVRVLNQTVETVSRLRISRRRPLMVFGGPPCQGFSISNQKTRNSRNSGNWLFKEYLRVVGEVQPHWAVFENVTGILQTEGGYFAREVHAGLTELGYALSTWILDAADFGVPQHRRRLFIVGSIKGILLSAPAGRPVVYR